MSSDSANSIRSSPSTAPTSPNNDGDNYDRPLTDKRHLHIVPEEHTESNISNSSPPTYLNVISTSRSKQQALINDSPSFDVAHNNNNNPLVPSLFNPTVVHTEPSSNAETVKQVQNNQQNSQLTSTDVDEMNVANEVALPATITTQDKSDNTNNSKYDDSSNSSTGSSQEMDSSNEKQTPQQPEGMTFPKKTVYKCNSMTSALSSFSSVVTPQHTTNKQKHHHPNQQQQNNRTGQWIESDIIPSEGILGTSCDCASPPSPPPVMTCYKSKIQAPVSRPINNAFAEKIGTQTPFESENLSAATSPDGSPTQMASRQSSTNKASSASPPLVLRKTHKYQPAVPVLPSEKLQSERLVQQSNGLTNPDYSFLIRPRETKSDHARAPYIMENSIVPDSTISLPSSLNTSGGIVAQHSRTINNPALKSENSRFSRRGLSSDSNGSDSVPLIRAASEFFQPKQIRDPITPMYVPAVLRRTSPQSRPHSPFVSPKTPAMSPERAPPTRYHWKPDQERESCRKCHKSFTFFDRRHHCRKCGDIFCGNDSRFTVYLDHHLNFNTLGYPSRGCESCFQGYRKHQAEMIDKRQQNKLKQQSEVAIAPLTKEEAGSPVPITAPLSSSLIKQAGNLDGVGSVPADWNWSTF